MSAVVASYTDCWQVEYCSLHGTASIFLALWITDNPQGQTMEASNSFKFLDNYFYHTLSFLILNVGSHFALKTSYCRWFRNPAITSWYGKYPIIDKVLAPSQVGFSNHQQSPLRSMPARGARQVELKLKLAGFQQAANLYGDFEGFTTLIWNRDHRIIGTGIIQLPIWGTSNNANIW